MAIIAVQFYNVEGACGPCTATGEPDSDGLTKTFLQRDLPAGESHRGERGEPWEDDNDWHIPEPSSIPTVKPAAALGYRQTQNTW